jgi:spore coat polysaccharide biosynthesis protein SpsF
MDFGVVLFARMNSSRLPGKALLPIGRRPLLGCVLDRARCVPGPQRIVIATSNLDADDPIAAFARDEGVDLFRGDLHDVGGRALACAEAFGFTRFARVCGDRPFFDPGLAARQRDMMDGESLDLATNVTGRRYPVGMASEVIRTDALVRALAESESACDREHVTPVFYRRAELFRIANIDAPDLTWAERTLAVDDETDLARARWIAAQADDPATLPAAEAVVLAKRWDAERAQTSPSPTAPAATERG